MAEGTSSAYVQLTKEHDAPVDEINPGELNQPVRVPHLDGRRCWECGQYLPPAHEPPAIEPWTTGICGCFEDMESCRMGLFCPCVLFGRNVERIVEGKTQWTEPCTCHFFFVEGGMALAAATGFIHGVDTSLIVEGLICTWMLCGTLTSNYRLTLQKKYHLQDSPCDPCWVHCCMHWCAICQEHREMNGRLEDVEMPATIVNPPATQEMNDNEDQGSTSSQIRAQS